MQAQLYVGFADSDNAIKLIVAPDVGLVHALFEVKKVVPVSEDITKQIYADLKALNDPFDIIPKALQWMQVHSARMCLFMAAYDSRDETMVTVIHESVQVGKWD